MRQCQFIEIEGELAVSFVCGGQFKGFDALVPYLHGLQQQSTETVGFILSEARD